jgi:hypothetical protein
MPTMRKDGVGAGYAEMLLEFFCFQKFLFSYSWKHFSYRIYGLRIDDKILQLRVGRPSLEACQATEKWKETLVAINLT